MSPFHTEQPDSLGLDARLPQPGWAVIDTIRSHQFTGEVICDTEPGVRVYADRGVVYIADRAADGELGGRLVSAGALSAEQLDRGAVRLVDLEHLGRLFDRDPSIDRDAVLVVTQMLTDDTLSWLAATTVPHATVTPYRHHPAGIHRWERPDVDETDGDAAVEALAAPVADFSAFSAPAGAPVAMPAPMPAPAWSPAPLTAPLPGAPMPPPAGALIPPAPAVDDAFEMLYSPAALTAPVDEPALEWNDPSWLDQPMTGDPDPFFIRPLSVSLPTSPSAPAPENTPVRATGSLLAGMGDWIDRLGAADTVVDEPAERDPVVGTAGRPLGVDAIDRFEVIWPTGEIDQQFGSQIDEPVRNPDIDRAGTTARLVLDGGARVADSTVIDALGSGVADIEQWLASEAGDATDDIVLAVRRTVAGIDAGVLSQRPTSTTTMIASASPTFADPAIEAIGTQPVAAASARMTHPGPAAGSVFDTMPASPSVAPTLHVEPFAAVETSGQPVADERTSALKRLIGSLRRR